MNFLRTVDNQSAEDDRLAGPRANGGLGRGDVHGRRRNYLASLNGDRDGIGVGQLRLLGVQFHDDAVFRTNPRRHAENQTDVFQFDALCHAGLVQHDVGNPRHPLADLNEGGTGCPWCEFAAG